MKGSPSDFLHFAGCIQSEEWLGKGGGSVAGAAY